MKKNRAVRQQGALERLKASKFYEKNYKNGQSRNEETWEKKRDRDIEILEKRLNV